MQQFPDCYSTKVSLYELKKYSIGADHIGDIDGQQCASFWPLHKDCHQTANESWCKGDGEEVEVL